MEKMKKMSDEKKRKKKKKKRWRVSVLTELAFKFTLDLDVCTENKIIIFNFFF